MKKHKKKKTLTREERKEAEANKKILTINLIIALALGPLGYFVTKNIVVSLVATGTIFFLLTFFVVGKKSLDRSARVKKIEKSFPDLLQLMASNLRAGMTVDRAILLSSRKEFAPLDEEILKVGKDIVTGSDIEEALHDLARRVKSEKIEKVVNVIRSGIKSGGNLAIILEETARNMKEREFVEKKAASNTLMYTIFIFFATAAGAPLLFSLSAVLVEILSGLLATLPEIDASANVPFTLTNIGVSNEFITGFSIVFLITIDILGSLILGLVHKGEEKDGLRYIIPLIVVSLIIFFIVRIVLTTYFGENFFN